MSEEEKNKAAAQKIQEAIEALERVRDSLDLRLMKIRIEIAKAKARQSASRDQR